MMLSLCTTPDEGQDWRTASRQLEAFFVSAKDGRLLSKRVWPTSVRGAGSDDQDSESRLIPLSDGRFLVLANHTMLLYGSNLELLRQKKLGPSTPGDLWSAQSVAGGHKIFLRHQSASEQQTVYFWIDPDTLLSLAQMSGPPGKNFSTAVTGGDDFVLTVPGLSGHGMTIGMVMAGLDGATKIICSDELCGEGGWLVLSSSRVAISGRHGIGVVDVERGLLWSQRIPSTSSPNDFEFGDIETSMCGNRFAIWATAYHKTFFDGVKLSQSPTLLLYDTTSSHNLFSIPVDRQTGDFDFALSPDGSEIAIFDGTRVRLYAVDATPRMGF